METKTVHSPLTTDELDRFRSLLNGRQAAILRSCQELTHVALHKPGEVTDDAADLAAETQEQDLSLNFLGRAQLELREISQALERIDRRSYGLCDDCGRPIPGERLEALPAAAYCVPCKVNSEGP
jgi:DnaK suppressor protein